MNEIFVNIKNENAWIKEQFNNEEIVSIEDIFTVIEDLIFENEHLKEKIKELETEKDYYDIYDAHDEYMERMVL